MSGGRIVVLDGTVEQDPEVVGNKGASLSRMSALGLPVPPAFVLPIDECRRFHAAGRRLEDETWAAVLGGIATLEERTGRRFGDPAAPLLVSVRSGAAVSMPGMMDTVLNLGLNDDVEAGLAALSGDAAFARDTHTRFCRDFGEVVLGADVEGAGADAAPADMRAAVLDDTGDEVPQAPLEQLRAAIHAVFGSWSSRRAVAFRRHWGISEDGGTAVVVQAMVFGNLGEDSGTGVLFSRDPLTGAPEVYGEWLPGGQGEDVVAGTHDPLPLAALGDAAPELHAELLAAAAHLERERRDVQDIEFTIERGTLYLLQTRAAKRSPGAALRTAADLVAEGLIDRTEALRRVSVEQLQTVVAPRLADDVAAAATVLARGVPACPGVATGRVVLDAAAAEAARGEDVVLARPTTSPDDVAGMIAACAVVTEKGGSTSHAAVVTRALGRPSVVGIGDGTVGGWAGGEVTVDGSAGVVYAGRLATQAVSEDDIPGLAQIAAWTREAVAVEVVDAAPDVLDLDAAGSAVDADAVPDVAELAERMRGRPAVSGSVLATPEGAQAVLRAGVPTVVRLPAQHPAALRLLLAQASAP